MKAQRGPLGFQSHTARYELHNNPELSCITRHSRRDSAGKTTKNRKTVRVFGKINAGYNTTNCPGGKKKTFIFKMFSYVYEEK